MKIIYFSNSILNVSFILCNNLIRLNIAGVFSSAVLNISDLFAKEKSVLAGAFFLFSIFIYIFPIAL